MRAPEVFPTPIATWHTGRSLLDLLDEIVLELDAVHIDIAVHLTVYFLNRKRFDHRLVAVPKLSHLRSEQTGGVWGVESGPCKRLGERPPSVSPSL